MDMIFHDEDDQELKDETMSIFTKEYGYFSAREESLLLDMSTVVTMRDIVGGGSGGTSMMCRIKSALEKFVPSIRGKIFPSCLKHKLGYFDAQDNDPITSCLHSVTVSKDETKTRLANHSCLVFPGRLLERMYKRCRIENELITEEPGFHER